MNRYDNNGRPTSKHHLANLDVYILAKEVYEGVRTIAESSPPGSGDLQRQMRRSARSVVLNIAEGAGKRGPARAAAYEIARGEVMELYGALDCAVMDENTDRVDAARVQVQLDSVAATLSKMIRIADDSKVRLDTARRDVNV